MFFGDGRVVTLSKTADDAIELALTYVGRLGLSTDDVVKRVRGVALESAPRTHSLTVFGDRRGILRRALDLRRLGGERRNRTSPAVSGEGECGPNELTAERTV